MSPTRKDVELKRMYKNKKFRGSFSGVHSFYNSLPKHLKNLGRKHVESVLQDLKIYSQNRPAPHKFKRRRVVVHGIDQQWAIDLVDLNKLKRYNNNNRYLFSCIDVFSKYAWVEPMKTKTSAASLKVFKNILRKSGRKPRKIQVDKGTEFKGQFKRFCDQNGIQIFSVESDLKACVVERFHRTLLEKVWRYLQYKSEKKRSDRRINDKKYVDGLQDIVRNYNSVSHSSIGIPPAKVNSQNEMDVWMRLYGREELKAIKPPKFTLGDNVLISIYKNKLVEKGYDKKYHDEIFKIVRISDTNPRMYYIQDKNGENIQGGFYERELSKINR